MSLCEIAARWCRCHPGLALVVAGLAASGCGTPERGYTHVGVLAGALDGQSVSGTVRLTKDSGGLSGRARLSSGGELLFVSDGGGFPVDGRIGFVVGTSDGTRGEFVFGSVDGGPEQFVGRFTGADGGLSAATRGSEANDDTRLYCGSFAGSATGVWNIGISSGVLVDAFSGFDGTSEVQGYLSGSSTGTTVDIIWSALFGYGPASGEFSGASVSGNWEGYRDGGTWTSSESCPTF